MNSLSHLESFLNELKSSGEIQGQGHFTLAREKALEKLAEFQLPFEGAWIGKVVQSAIAFGVETPLAVGQTRRVTSVRFAGKPACAQADLEAAFFDPHPTGVRAIDHLTKALWAVGLKEKRSFEIALAGDSEALVWDGAKVHTVARVPVPETVLIVTHQSPQESSDWLFDPFAASRHNAEVATALRDYCYTSPLPITVDGRRIDGLHHCPEQGWSNRSFPLSLSFLHGQLPELRWPSGTFEAMEEGAGNHALADGGGLEGASRAVWRGLKEVKTSSVAVLVTAHVYPVTTPGGQKQSAGTWRLAEADSRCYWIQDGVVVQRERVNSRLGGVSAALFLSADDLENDLTSLHLRQSPEKDRRFREATDLAALPIRALAKLSLEDITSHNRKRYQKLGNGVLVLALGLGWTFGWGVVAPVSMLMGLFGFMARFAQRAEQSQLMTDLLDSLHAFDRSWRSEKLAAASTKDAPPDASAPTKNVATKNPGQTAKAAKKKKKKRRR
jgi:hypothetical protein